ncbi:MULTISPECIES: vWA domain-containing protein [unclassified Tolypothrix]|uniref:vWA domain-containing protein n=1 Tax=unclassified Tolypothrix TaxID=2649714 RepID=UPI0005EAAA35|nr:MULTISPECIES: VWA domain-containing protein [unclassified Tolypothrix]BAY95739.1 hypothetical protein NIES3275_78160 [Microchaete diplosiphon NIES-3275]EKE97267.1 putative von Willebrand factor type A domain protein [Tolypothrix sp. PCC 7601]MBE9082287.1 VWA domain-containing protein [Tolypothrix sp. LEGE 11397]UYD30767.1 VWA domain-containing protein [Tolypothrix sp. PCC 7712]UYD38639.1 VWA domain-containing protein [Tolypothrix sp. PCC 7601]
MTNIERIIERIEEYITIHPNQTIWEYIQEHPEETQYLLGRSYEELQGLISEIILRDQDDLTNKNRIVMLVQRDKKLNELKYAVEAEILLSLFVGANFSLEFRTLGLLFKVSESTARSIYEYWEPALNEEILLQFVPGLDFYITEDCCNIQTYSLGSGSGQIKNSLSGSGQIKNSLIGSSSGFDCDFDIHVPACSPQYELSADSYSGKYYQDDAGYDFQFNPKTQSLPHDGLFIRRNNQFGTRLNVGIKDLIDQGELIDQRNIRFDDFINSERVPSPEAGQSLAVSYGIAPIQLSQKRDERATHYLEIALKTSDLAPSDHPKNKAPSANYIFVIDTSGSMFGDKLNDVKSSIKELFQRMKDDDVIGIITFDTQPKTLLKATRISKINFDNFSQIISGMIADGGTDINVALSFGIDEINRYGNNNTLNHIYLFSDGNPMSGETNWIKIRQNIDSKIRGNNSKTRGNIRLSTFAFGSDANTKELDALAGLTGGKSTFVRDIDDIKNSLQEELHRREHLAALNVQIKVDIGRDIEILYLYGHDLITEPAKRAAVIEDAQEAKKNAEEEFGVTSEADLITEEEGIKIFVPDLAVGETYWLVFELGIPEEKSQMPVGKATVQYVDTFARKSQKPEFALAFAGNLAPDLVVEHSLALWTSEVAFYVLDDLYEKDVKTAQKRIEKHASLLRVASSDLGSDYIADDAVTLCKFASLFENLGRVQLMSDVTPSQPYQNVLYFGLSEFGRVRGGFRRADYYSV